MRYIGNKIDLLNFINRPLEERNIRSGVFCDIFSGTANVAKFFKRNGFTIISNDNMTFSFVFQKAYIENNYIPGFLNLREKIENPNIFKVINYLNNLRGKRGFIYKNFTLEGTKKSKYKRNYFSPENARKIDSIRDEIEEWKKNNLISEVEFYILLCSILEEVPSVSNIAGTYGAFLKINDPRMFKPFTLSVPNLIQSNLKHQSFLVDANELIRQIKCDILYADPPYNTRQYAPNYHMWETIAVWDKKLLDSKTGLRPWSHQKSLYCSKSKCIEVFEDLIKNAKCKFILFSYNTEGIIPYDEIMRVLSSRGKVSVYTQDYRRFKSNSNGRTPKERLRELLFFVEVTHNNS